MFHFRYFILSQVTYGLEGLWFTRAEQKHLDAFYVKSPRRILRIPHAYYSRISNQPVLQRANSAPLSHILLKAQLKYFARISSLSHRNPIREFIFADDSESFRERIFEFHRRRGRPRQFWISEMFRLAIRAAGCGNNAVRHAFVYPRHLVPVESAEPGEEEHRT